MKTIKMIPIWMALACCGVAWPASVSWTLGTTSPAGWSITPANPTSSQVVSFSGPTGVFSNSCVGQTAAGGTPTISVNTLTKTVTLDYLGPAPTVCTLIYMPVCGLDGQFGPLAAGRWTFKGTTPQGEFEVRFTVGSVKTIYVDADSTSTSPNGTTWAKAYQEVPDALAVAWSGDEVRVAEGTYKPSQSWLGRRSTIDLPMGVKLKGGYAGNGNPNPNARDVEAYPTILSGDLAGDDLWGILNRDENAYHVVTMGAGFPGATLDGFTITGGQADGPSPHQIGGGVYVNGSSPKIVNCVLKENTGVFGGGLGCLGGSVSMGNSTLSGNRAYVLGGGAFVQDGSLDMVNGLMVGNSSDEAEGLGGSALYILGAGLSLQDCTVADNTAPQGKAITGFLWGLPVSETISVVNSILYNGVPEIGFNDLSTLAVTYSDVQGGWLGTGNLNVSPKFVSPGGRSIEGQWIDGDYHLQSSSGCIDAGNKSLLPKDALDLDADGNITETLPVDRDGATRVQNSLLNMGCYEQPGTGPGPGGSWVAVASLDVTYDVPNPPPGFPISVTGTDGSDVILNFPAVLKIEVVAASAAGGTWTAAFSPDPGTIGPGVVHVNYTVHADNFMPYNLTPGATNVKVATVTISAKPAP